MSLDSRDELPGMDTLTRLAALDAIRQLKARYWRLMDTKQWDELFAVFTDDVVMDMRGAGSEGSTARGPDAVVEYIRSHVGIATTVHMGHQVEIDLASATTATAVWMFEDILEWHDGSSFNGVRALHGWGHYHDRYALTSGGWRIASTAVTRLKLDVDRL